MGSLSPQFPSVVLVYFKIPMGEKDENNLLHIQISFKKLQGGVQRNFGCSHDGVSIHTAADSRERDGHGTDILGTVERSAVVI